jgi:hypothetical protein
MESITFQRFVAMCCVALMTGGDAALLAQETPKPAAPAAAAPAPAAGEDRPIPPDQLDALVAPIALYPDPLLAQTLVASTYPLEIIQLQQWMAKHKDLKDKALADAVAKEPWDPSIQSMAAFPDVVKRLGDDVQWTTDLGNAFLEQQADVMDAVQRMRTKAKNNGALESNEQQKVEAQVDGGKTVIVVQPANPEVIYVPSYAPTVVYGPPIYPYPPIYYPPPPPPGSAFVAFSFGVMMGAAFWGGSCCGCGWGHSSVNINVHNNFNQINHYGGGGNNNWNHNPQHRGAAPYSNKATANKYGGSAKGQSPGSRPSAGQQPAGGNRGASGGASAKQQPAGGGSRGAGAGASQQPAGGSRGGASGPSTANRSGSGASGGSSNRIGNQNVPSAGSRNSGFGGGSGGFSGSSARASSSRGSHSMGGRPGGGGGGARRR